MGIAVKRFLFIRHGETPGNAKRAYSGDSDERLSEKGEKAAAAMESGGELPLITELIISGAARCRQTAEILFPGIGYSVCRLSEIDFGVFKDKTADELAGNRDYENWLATNCLGDIPDGSSVIEFKKQCCSEFERISGKSGSGITAIVIHGGNIMAIMEKFALPRMGFYEYRIPNLGYYLCCFENGALRIEYKGGAGW